MPIRIRLTVWYTAVLAALVVCLGLAVYAVLSFSLTRQRDRTLAETADEVIGASRVRVLQDVRVVTVPELDVFRASNVYVQVWDAQRNLISQSGNLASFREPLDAQRIDSATQQTR